MTQDHLTEFEEQPVEYTFFDYVVILALIPFVLTCRIVEIFFK